MRITAQKYKIFTLPSGSGSEDRQNGIGLPKNEGCTRNFLGRGNAAPQVMDFITIKFEQAKRALTRLRAFNSKYFIFLCGYPHNFAPHFQFSILH